MIILPVDLVALGGHQLAPLGTAGRLLGSQHGSLCGIVQPADAVLSRLLSGGLSSQQTLVGRLIPCGGILPVLAVVGLALDADGQSVLAADAVAVLLDLIQIPVAEMEFATIKAADAINYDVVMDMLSVHVSYYEYLIAVPLRASRCQLIPNIMSLLRSNLAGGKGLYVMLIGASLRFLPAFFDGCHILDSMSWITVDAADESLCSLTVTLDILDRRPYWGFGVDCLNCCHLCHSSLLLLAIVSPRRCPSEPLVYCPAL